MKAMVELARASLSNQGGFHSRFKNPNYFSPEDADRYFSTWVRNFIETDGFNCAVIDVEDRVVGYLLYSRVEPYNGEARYRSALSAVAAEFRGRKGLTALFSFVARNLPEDRYYWEVLTQLTNFAVITFRIHAGFRIGSLEHILYRGRGATLTT